MKISARLSSYPQTCNIIHTTRSCTRIHDDVHGQPVCPTMNNKLLGYSFIRFNTQYVIIQISCNRELFFTFMLLLLLLTGFNGKISNVRMNYRELRLSSQIGEWNGVGLPYVTLNVGEEPAGMRGSFFLI